MKQKGHGTIKKSKAYGAIGTLLLSGVLIATLGTASISADETVVETHQVDQLTTDNLQHLDQTVIDDNESISAEPNFVSWQKGHPRRQCWSGVLIME